QHFLQFLRRDAKPVDWKVQLLDEVSRRARFLGERPAVFLRARFSGVGTEEMLLQRSQIVPRTEMSGQAHDRDRHLLGRSWPGWQRRDGMRRLLGADGDEFARLLRNGTRC